VPKSNVVQFPTGRGRPRRAERLSRPLGLLAAAAFAGLVAGQYWAERERAAVVVPVPTTIDTQTADVIDDADLEWASRAVERDSAGEQAAAAGAHVRFGFCHSGGGSNCVVDGDTFYIGGAKVRIAGIDAPETHPARCDAEAQLGRAATQQLQQLLNSGAVTLTGIGRDRDNYGRLLRNVAVDGADVGQLMIGAGVAREYGSGRKGWCG
jgi:endonuclease YncB( thermonuclease family)